MHPVGRPLPRAIRRPNLKEAPLMSKKRAIPANSTTAANPASSSTANPVASATSTVPATPTPTVKVMIVCVPDELPSEALNSRQLDKHFGCHRH
ncbi:hypothetical protein GCM10020218_067870 [Dactylosporangium vinaceum]